MRSESYIKFILSGCNYSGLLWILITVAPCNAQFVNVMDNRPVSMSDYYNAWLNIQPKDRLDAAMNVGERSIGELKILLRNMFDADQQFRDSLHNGSQSPEKKKYYWVKILETDWTNQMLLEKIILKHGWPSTNQFGVEATEIAWYIIWHADREFALKHLGAVEKAFMGRKIRANQYLSLRERWKGY